MEAEEDTCSRLSLFIIVTRSTCTVRRESEVREDTFNDASSRVYKLQKQIENSFSRVIRYSIWSINYHQKSTDYVQHT